MPLYDYDCDDCGVFERLAGMGQVLQPCPSCGGMAKRLTVYTTNNIIAGQSLPRRDDVESVQDEYRKDVHKRGWTAERSVEGLRSTRFTDAEGQLRVDTRKMPQAA